MDDPFRFTECDLGHDGAVGKRSPAQDRLFFLAAMAVNKVNPMGTKNGRRAEIQKAKAHPEGLFL